MQKVDIILNMANVMSFVNTVSRYSFDIDLRSGRHVVDAKSILGIFSLNLSRPITVEIDDENADAAQVAGLIRDIEPFAAR